MRWGEEEAMREGFMTLILGRPEMRYHGNGMEKGQKISNEDTVWKKKVIDEAKNKERGRDRQKVKEEK